jgi:hypothetical protein
MAVLGGALFKSHVAVPLICIVMIFNRGYAEFCSARQLVQRSVT